MRKSPGRHIYDFSKGQRGKFYSKVAVFKLPGVQCDANPTGRGLDVSQQTIQAYEAGRRRIPVSALPVVARTLSVSLEDLFGEVGQTARGKRGPTPKWAQQIEAIARLPKAQQRFVAQMLDTVLSQAASR